MSLIKVGIIIELFLLVVVFLWIRKINSKQIRQPSLSKKTIKNLKFFIVFFDRDGCLACFLFSFLTHKKTPTNKKISTIIPTFIKLIFYPLFSCWCPLCMAQGYLITTF